MKNAKYVKGVVKAFLAMCEVLLALLIDHDAGNETIDAFEYMVTRVKNTFEGHLEEEQSQPLENPHYMITSQHIENLLLQMFDDKLPHKDSCFNVDGKCSLDIVLQKVDVDDFSWGFESDDYDRNRNIQHILSQNYLLGLDEGWQGFDVNELLAVLVFEGLLEHGHFHIQWLSSNYR